jgi:striatin 1/3/4
MAVEETARPPSSPAPNKMSLPDELDDSPSEVEVEEEVVPAEEEEEKQMLTAIYRPDSSAAWREELRAANEKAEQVC